MLLLTQSVQDPLQQTACAGNYPLSIDDVSFSPSGLQANQQSSFTIEGYNDGDTTIYLTGVTFYLQQGTNAVQSQFFLQGGNLQIAPDQEYKVMGDWTPAIQGWPNGRATLSTYLGSNNVMVGCDTSHVNISAMALGFAALLVLS